jgi:hypothetical protein
VSACFFCFVSGSNLACTLPRYTAVIRDEITAKWESHLTHFVDNIILLLSELSFLTKYLSTHPSTTISADSALFPSRRLDRCTYSFFSHTYLHHCVSPCLSSRLASQVSSSFPPLSISSPPLSPPSHSPSYFLSLQDDPTMHLTYSTPLSSHSFPLGGACFSRRPEMAINLFYQKFFLILFPPSATPLSNPCSLWLELAR